MRGHQRIRVLAVHGGTAAASGALMGFALSVAALVLRVPAPSARVAGGVVLLAVVLDAVARRVGWLVPLAVHTQVPREWGRLFSPETAAALYGLRLGVGPLTILTTWLWWAAVLPAAALGPGPSVAAGVTFGLGRVVVSNVALALSRRRGVPAARMEAVRHAERSVTTGVTVLVVLLATVGLLAG